MALDCVTSWSLAVVPPDDSFGAHPGPLTVGCTAEFALIETLVLTVVSVLPPAIKSFEFFICKVSKGQGEVSVDLLALERGQRCNKWSRHPWQSQFRKVLHDCPLVGSSEESIPDCSDEDSSCLRLDSGVAEGHRGASCIVSINFAKTVFLVFKKEPKTI